MIETHLILLGANIFQRNRGDSGREERRQDERPYGWGEREYFKSSASICWPTYWFWVGVYILVCVCVSVFPHGIFPAAACISDRLLLRCFPLAVFLYLLHLCSLSEKVYPLGPIWAPGLQGLCIPKAPTHRSPSGSLFYHREYPPRTPRPLRLWSSSSAQGSQPEGRGGAVWEYN